jgi:aldose 1-epimerase
MKKGIIILQSLLIAILVFSCNSVPIHKTTESKILNMNNFDTTLDGKKVTMNTLSNHNGIQVFITNYGARIVGILVPAKNDSLIDVVLGFKSIGDYVKSHDPYFGPCVGRVCNRIAKGKFTIDGTQYSLVTNNGPNHLHGGIKGLHKVVWDFKKVSDSEILLSYLSPDMEEGYPGNLKISVRYSLSEDNSLSIEFKAFTDKKTPVNLTNHTYFNLSGSSNISVNNHILMINADNYTPVDSTLIPLGTVNTVEGSPFDFRKPKSIGRDVDQKDIQLKHGGGYDHNFVLNKASHDSLTLAARVFSPESGVQMEVYTTEPGIQFYGGNFFTGELTGKDGKKVGYRCGLALEPQHFPDSPNQPAFESIILSPGETYHSLSKYVFGIKKPE